MHVDAERHRRTMDVPGIGPSGRQRLAASRVLVVGAGGLGSPVLTYLVAGGVGSVVIADGDIVEVSNLQRQVLHLEESVGLNKAVSASARLRQLDSSVQIDVVPAMLNAESLAELLPGVDLVIDCCDSFGIKLMIDDVCGAVGMPRVWGSAVSMIGQVSVFGVADAHGHVWRLRDLHPVEPAVGTYPMAVDVGVLGAMVGQVGSVMATEAIKLLAGFGEPLVGRLLILDAAAGRWDVVTVRAAES